MSKKKPAEKKERPTSSVPDGEVVPVEKGSKIYLVDGSGYIFRAFHALPPLTRPSDGLPVGAIHGFCAMLWKLINDTKASEAPTHVAVLFDHSAKTFRNDIYPEYKANRPPPPEELIPQFPLIRDAVQAFNIACIEQEGYEADDLIATYAKEAVDAGADVVVVSSDKDLMQLVQPGLTMFDSMKNKSIGQDEVLAKFGVPPDKVVDVQSLAGDSTDNVPGVPGIGIKTAAELINTYDNLDELLGRADEIKQPKRRERLIEFADQARISRDLVRLDQNVPVEITLEQAGLQEPRPDKLLTFLREMEFNTLTKRIAEALGVEPPPMLERSVGETVARKSGAKSKGKGASIEAGTPDAAVAYGLKQATGIPVERSKYETVATQDALDAWISAAREKGYVSFDTETSSLDASTAELVGISLAIAPGEACYIPLAHSAAGTGFDFGEGDDGNQLPIQDVLSSLKPLLEDPAVLKIGQNLKYDAVVLKQYSIDLKPIDDTMLLSYALDAGRGEHGMDAQALRHLGHVCMSFGEVITHIPGFKKGTKKSNWNFAQVPINKATEYAAEDADVTLRLWLALKPRLAAEHRATVYETLERPLLPVIADMEWAGIKVDRTVLSRLSGTFAQRIGALESEVYDLAGEKFNLASPKQLGEFLFDKLKLPGGKKTKTGQWETRATLLDDLSQNEELPEDARKLINTMIEWRQLSKLKSTYTDALPNFINEKTGRIHTSYALAATTTGRLASTDPNLQNIPIRTKEGREIRTAFVAEKGCKLISADYSQIELRVLAHIADISQLKKAFDDGLDIHAMTASEMFGVPIKDMPPDVRRRAKAINFGIIYGISAFGLANQLGIPRAEAADYIKTYFARFPGIKDYIEATKKFVHANGYVKTIFGRHIHYPEVNTRNPHMRGFLERAAINAPIQGSAADIIRRAMIRMPAAIKNEKLKSARMLLQVHDELVFEAKSAEVKKTMKMAVDVMENACLPAISLSVPLKVDAKSADNWEAAH